MSLKVIVVGAGPAGLNAAQILRANGYEVTVLEQQSRIGGRVATDLIDGYRCDHGFQVINPAYSELRRTGLVEKLQIHPLSKGFEIFIDEKLVRVGDPRKGLGYLLGDVSSRTGTLSEKVHFLRYLASKAEDQSFGIAMSACGDFYQKVIKRFLQGVFLINPDDVSSLMAHELLRWFIRGNPGVPHLGVQALPNLLGEGLDIRTESRVQRIKSGEVQTSEERLSADVVLIATNEVSAASLLDQPAPSMNKSVTWYHSVPAGEIKSNHLRLDPADVFVNSVAISNVAPSYAPVGRTLISSTALDVIPSSEVLTRVGALWGVDPKSLEYVQHFELTQSLPKHLPGKPLISPSRVRENIYIAGDHRATPSQQGALLSGRLAAEAIIADL
jgi:phytoene dehydrogenase-like protein